MADQINPSNVSRSGGSFHHSSTRNLNSRNNTGRLSLGPETRRQNTNDLIQSARNAMAP